MKRIVVVLLMLIFILAGCSGSETKGTQEKTSSAENPSTEESSMEEPSAEDSSVEEQSAEVSVSTSQEMEESTQPETEESSIPGSYVIPEGWVVAKQYSTAEKIFFVKAGQEDGSADNISINVGTNRYSADEHVAFREAIVEQLLMQLQGIKAELNGDGTYTEQGYILYIFTIKEEETGVVTRLYYIVDDYRYCLVQLTNYTADQEADEAAQALTDSFVWNKDQ